MAWKAGVAEAVITPPMGVEMSGYGYYLNRKSANVADDLRCVAVALQEGETTVVLAACDLLGFDVASMPRIRARVQEATGLPPQSIAFPCTHTHSGPATFYLRGCGEVDPAHVAILERTVAGAMIRAVNALEPVTLRFGTGSLDGVAFNRVDKEGPVDTKLGVLAVERAAWEPIAVLTWFSCHPVHTVGGDVTISRDFCGIAADIVESVLPSARFAYLQGSCGDINPIRAHTGRVRESGTLLAGEVLKTYTAAAPLDGTLAAHSEENPLPLRRWTKEEITALYESNHPKYAANPADASARFFTGWGEMELARLDESLPLEMPCEIQVFRIGDLTLAFNPTELFTTFSLGIQAKHKNPIWNVGYSNGFLGYLPDPPEYRRGGYAALQVPKILDFMPFVDDVGEPFVEGVMKAIARIASVR